MNPMLEKDIERKVVAYAKSKGVLCFKFASPGNRGVPDRILIKNGRVLFLELKRPGQQPTALQLHVIDQLLDAGVLATWADSFDAAKWCINDLCAL